MYKKIGFALKITGIRKIFDAFEVLFQGTPSVTARPARFQPKQGPIFVRKSEVQKMKMKKRTDFSRNFAEIRGLER